jgi:glycosyltransferase involved in cell wall biosynthesis
MKKKLSIITINYNNLEGLKRTVESVVNQTWQEFEYIIIDGGSTDGSAAYIERQSDKIDYWVSEPDNGIYSAMNKGIDKATGEYLLFLNSGDHLYSNVVIEKNHTKIRDHDLVYFNIKLVSDSYSSTVFYPEKLSFSFFYSGTLCHQATFIKRTLFEKLGHYDENLKLVSDWKFFILALFKLNCTYLKVNAVISTYYLDGISSDSMNEKLLYKERQQVLKTDFVNITGDLKELYKLRGIVSSFKKSKKINWLTKLGLLNRF